MAESDSTRFTRTFKRWQRYAAQAEASADRRRATDPRQLFLPGLEIGAMPNHLNRSSLFAPIARGKRAFHHRQVMVSRSDCVLEYTGEQLDEADADLIMALIHFARAYPLGEPVPINRAELLRWMGRGTGKHDYEWLHRRIKALTEATLFLEARKPDGSTRYRVGHSIGFHLLLSFHYDEETEIYTFQLDPRWVELFSNREYALLDWDKRLQIGRGQDMAKALQRLIATSSDSVQRYALDLLKAQMQYGGRLRDFRAALKRSIAELERLGIIACGRIETNTRGKKQLTLWVNKKKHAEK